METAKGLRNEEGEQRLQELGFGHCSILGIKENKKRRGRRAGTPGRDMAKIRIQCYGKHMSDLELSSRPCNYPITTVLFVLPERRKPPAVRSSRIRRSPNSVTAECTASQILKPHAHAAVCTCVGHGPGPTCRAVATCGPIYDRVRSAPARAVGR